MSKRTVSFPPEIAAGVEALIEAGAAESFSSYVAAATEAGLARDASLAALRAHTGGPYGGALRDRAERALGVPPSSTETSSAAAEPAAHVPGSRRKAS